MMIYDFENIDVINMTTDEYNDLYIEPEILKSLLLLDRLFIKIKKRFTNAYLNDHVHY